MKKFVVSTLVIMLAATVGCGGGGTDEEQIEAVVVGVHAAMKAGDVAKIKSMIIAEDMEQDPTEEQVTQMKEMAGKTEISVKDITVDGDTATAVVVRTMDEQEFEETMNFRKEGGSWKAVF